MPTKAHKAAGARTDRAPVLGALALLPFALPAWGGEFWLRGPGACANSGDGTAYECAASPGGAGAWIVDRGINVNTGKWGNTSSTVGAGDALYVCGYYNLPLTGHDTRTFLKIGVTAITWDANNPIVINLACPAGVPNGPSVADPVRADFIEDYRSRTWTNVSGNVWSTPLDTAQAFVTYLACDDPSNLGRWVDTNDVTGYGADTPDEHCEFDGRADAGTTLRVYSEGHPATYYEALYASARDFFATSGQRALRVIGDARVSDYTLTRGGVEFSHMARAIHTGTFSSATGFSSATIDGIYCKELGVCVSHEGQVGAIYYPRGFYVRQTGCENLARECVQASGKFGVPFEVAHNWAKNTNQSFSTGAFYINGGTDKTTHPNEGTKYVHHNYVDGVGWGRFWVYDGHGVYLESGTAGFHAYANYVRNLDGITLNIPQACFKSNTGYDGNAHYSSLCANARAMINASDSSNEGNANIQFSHLTGVGITGVGIHITGQAGDAPEFRNLHMTANGATYTLSEGSTTGAVWSGINAYGFVPSDYFDGTASAMTNRTTSDPKLVGGPNPTTAEGFRPSATSPLVGAGTDVGSVQDFFGDTYYATPDIGAFRRDSCYRRSRDGKLDMARTRAQVASRCLGIPGRYPEGL